jgi:hypothetical protein
MLHIFNSEQLSSNNPFTDTLDFRIFGVVWFGLI